MAGGFNQVILLGRVGSDPELRYTQSGTASVSISLATSRNRKDAAGEWHEETSWHRLKAFGKQAEVLGERLKKGELLFVEGRLDYWEAEGARGKLMVAEVIIEHFEFGGGKRAASEGGGSEAPPARRGGAQPAPERTGSRGAQRGPTPPRGGAGADSGGSGGSQANDPFPDDDIPF